MKQKPNDKGNRLTPFCQRQGMAIGVARIYTFDKAGHSVAFEQFSALHQILTETVLPETYPAPECNESRGKRCLRFD